MSQWQRFAELLADECRLLGELGDAALGLTDALVINDPVAGSTTRPPFSSLFI